MERSPDESLVARYHQSGDQRALNELFNRYLSRVSAWCYRIAGDREQAADLAQEVFMKVYRNLDSFRGDSKFSTWIYSIARNHCLTYARSHAARPIELGEESLDLLATSLPDAHSALERRDREQIMRQLVQRVLDETEMRVMFLHYVEKVGLDAITRTLGLTNSSGAKAYIVSARRKLKAEADRWRARNILNSTCN